jgi:hypothetical protein
MSRRHNGNNAFALAHGNRLAADLTHGVTCTFTGGCRVFDANINKKHEAHWRCERHGGAKHSRAYAKDEEYANGIPGAERRARFARFRNKGKEATTTFHIPTFLDDPVARAQPAKARSAKIASKINAKSAKQKQREEAMKALGLTEADLIKFAESN